MKRAAVCPACSGKGWVAVDGRPFPVLCRCKTEKTTQQALAEAERKANRRRFTGERMTGFGGLGA